MQGLPPDVILGMFKEVKEWGFPALLLLVILFRIDRTLFPLLKEYIQSHTEMANALKTHSEHIGMLANRVDESSENLHRDNEGLGQMITAGQKETQSEVEKLAHLVSQVEANTKIALDENRQTLRVVKEISRALKKVQNKEADPYEQSSEGI